MSQGGHIPQILLDSIVLRKCIETMCWGERADVLQSWKDNANHPLRNGVATAAAKLIPFTCPSCSGRRCGFSRTLMISCESFLSHTLLKALSVPCIASLPTQTNKHPCMYAILLCLLEHTTDHGSRVPVWHSNGGGRADAHCILNPARQV